VVVAEIVLREIPVQVLLAAVLVDAAHAPLEDREHALNRVAVNVAANVFADRVLDGVV
jgi:hypothetical protein